MRAPEKGTLEELYAKEQETVRVGSPLFSYTPGGEEKQATKPVEETKAQQKPVEQPTTPQQPTTSQQPQAQPQQQPPKQVEQKPIVVPTISGTRTERREPMSRMRQRIAERLLQSQQQYAMLTTFQEVDMSEVINMRAKFGEEFQKRHGIKLGFMSPFVAAATRALIDQPVVNAGNLKLCLFIF